MAPVLTELILNREPEKVLAFVEKVSKWPIRRIIPGHLNNNIIINNSREFSNAFNFLRSKKTDRQQTIPSSNILSLFLNKKKDEEVHNESELEANDLKLMRTLSDLFTKLGVIAPSKI